MMELAEKAAPTDEEMAYLAADGAILASLVLALHQWLRQGGFPPGRWQHAFSQARPEEDASE
jgi:hypothetical protein